MPSPVPLIYLAFFLVWLQAFFQASAQMPTRGIYSDVTLPYLTWGAMYEHLRVVPPGKRLRVPPHTRLEILGSG